MAIIAVLIIIAIVFTALALHGMGKQSQGLEKQQQHKLSARRRGAMARQIRRR